MCPRLQLWFRYPVYAQPARLLYNGVVQGKDTGEGDIIFSRNYTHYTQPRSFIAFTTRLTAMVYAAWRIVTLWSFASFLTSW
jgi:hypothetical protein